MKLRILVISIVSALFAFSAHAQQRPNTSGRCPSGYGCQFGESATNYVKLKTDGASMSVDETSNALTLTATTTNAAVFTGADAAGASDTIYDTTGAGTVAVGSADVTSVSIVTDGGTVTIDGTIDATVVAPVSLVSLASGALTVNKVHIATAEADYDLPDSCDTATGNWVTVVVQDASETVSIGLTDTADTIQVGGLALDADDELDSPTAGATTAGASITLTCLAANTWFSTAAVGTWVDGGAAD